MNRASRAFVVLGLVLFSGTALAKTITPPRSLVPEQADVLFSTEEIAGRELHFANFAHKMTAVERPGALRVAVPIPLALNLADVGTWETLDDGGRLCRLRVRSEGAVFLSFKLSSFALPEGAELHFVSVDRDYHDGPYTHRHNRTRKLDKGRSFRRFGSPMIPGDAAVIELYLPPGAGAATLVLESVSHGFRDLLGMGSFAYRETADARAKQVPTSPAIPLKAGNFDCQRDINCPEGAPYQDEKRAVAEGYDGAYICSGQLVNNVRQDNRYLYITAAHCEWWKDPAGMAFYWNYENSGCGTNDPPPWTYSTGSTDLFHDASADVNLLELDGTDLEGTFNIYFTGWNRGTTAPSMGSLISHPDDKPKQITITYDPVIDCATDSCGGGWGDGWWRVVNWDVGMDEGGSSGGGLLDQNNLLVGVLTGGIGSDCNDFVWDEFAKIGPSWAGLKPHLDPDNSGAVSVPGKDGVSTGPGQASGPSPADGATDVALNAVLSWTAGAGADSHDVYFGTDPSPDSGEFQGNQAGTTFDPGPLANDTTYTWRIDEVNAQGTTTGQVWSFTTESEPGPPGSASNPSPADGATHVAVDAPVGWTAGSQADSHDVYFGTSPSPGAGEFQGNQTQTSFDPGTMANELTYYWRIDEVNALGTTGGATWSFTTELEAPPDVVTITKAEYKADKDEFKVESTSSEQPAAVLTVEDWGEMTWKNNKYELKIKPLAPLTAPSMVTVTSDLGGSDTAPVQGAPQPSVPGQAGDPSPGDGATGVSIETTLAWTAGSGTDSHDVYFGTNPNPGGGEFQGNQAGTGFDPGTLANATTYYWRVDEVNVEGTTTGEVWSFTTESQPGPPGPASAPVPGNGATGVSVDANLSWTAGSQAQSHDVYFGTSPSPGGGEFQGNQAGTGFDPGTLANATTYYWRVDEVNAQGTTAGAVWSFTTEPVGQGDTVTITKAEWKSDKQELKVESTSSDQPAAVLTVVGWGQMTWKNGKYEYKKKPVANPGTVTVESSSGGSDTATVKER